MSSPLSSPAPRAALVHYWFLGDTGGERVSRHLAPLLGRPEVFCLVADERTTARLLPGRPVHQSPLRLLPGVRTHYRWCVPFYAWAAGRLDLRAFNPVLTSDAFVMKGVRVAPGARHICYCHTPMRHAWHLYEESRQRMGACKRALFSLVMGRLRAFDRRAARRVTVFVANSEHVRRRIRRYYGRDATVVYPPVDVDRFGRGPGSAAGDGYYLVVSRLVSYKRVDLAVEVCAATGRRLRVAGVGPEAARLRRLGNGRVEFLGRVSDEELARLYVGCRALLFCGEEDFGMVPVEAMACGKPVIAFGRGGACETVIDNRTGLLFREQTPEALAGILERFEAGSGSFEPESIRRHAGRFGPERFAREMRRIIAPE